MYRDSSVAHLLDLRRRLKVAMGVLGEMIRDGFTLARSLEVRRTIRQNTEFILKMFKWYFEINFFQKYT